MYILHAFVDICIYICLLLLCYIVVVYYCCVLLLQFIIVLCCLLHVVVALVVARYVAEGVFHDPPGSWVIRDPAE